MFNFKTDLIPPHQLGDVLRLKEFLVYFRRQVPLRKYTLVRLHAVLTGRDIPVKHPHRAVDAEQEYVEVCSRLAYFIYTETVEHATDQRHKDEVH